MLQASQLASGEGNVQKSPFQQGRSHFDARSVFSVREYGKRARTPLAAFFQHSQYVRDEQCRQTGWIDTQNGKLFLREP